MNTAVETATLRQLSNELATLAERAGQSVVRVDDGSRFTATGLIWSADGLVLTTSHGLERDDDLAVVTGDDERLATTLVGRDTESDLALLRAPGVRAPLDEADDAAARVGSLALAIARPGNSGLHCSLGTITARRRPRVLQDGWILSTDASLQPGFSGGAFVSMEGKLLGLTNRMFGRGSGVVIGSTVLRAVADALSAHGFVKRGSARLGVRTQPVHLQSSADIGSRTGALVVHIESGSAAEQSGLLVGDILLTVAGAAVDSGESLRIILRTLPAGSPYQVGLLRGGEDIELAISPAVG